MPMLRRTRLVLLAVLASAALLSTPRLHAVADTLPAQILGLRDRGQIREGFAADLTIFDPAAVSETNSFEKPKSYPSGIPYTIVNGVLVIDGGKHTGARPGRPLMGHGYAGK